MARDVGPRTQLANGFVRLKLRLIVLLPADLLAGQWLFVLYRQFHTF